MITKDIESVYQTKDLLKRTIENKVYMINEKKYEATVRELIIYTRLTVELEILSPHNYGFFLNSPNFCRFFPFFL
ncbi:sporulation protein [Bacillus subtilis]|nr:sporulation protein [Bacillus subtilis]